MKLRCPHCHTPMQRAADCRTPQRLFECPDCGALGDPGVIGRVEHAERAVQRVQQLLSAWSDRIRRTGPSDETTYLATAKHQLQKALEP